VRSAIERSFRLFFGTRAKRIAISTLINIYSAYCYLTFCEARALLLAIAEFMFLMILKEKQFSNGVLTHGQIGDHYTKYRRDSYKRRA
jgi:hypothetical protein